MHKKILSGLLAIALVFGSGAVLPVEELADSGVISVSAETYGDYEYAVLSDGTVEITSYNYNGTDSVVTIPSTINGKKVTSIGAHSIPTIWGDKLVTVIIPNSVTSIGDCAFEWSSALESVKIPNSVTNIGDGAFRYCSNLKNIVIPNSVTSIGEETFYNCYNLESIVIPNSVTNIENLAFGTCYSLTNITIPDSVTNIGGGAFSGTQWLDNKREENPLVEVNGILIDGYYCSDSVIIPDTVTSIGNGAFESCNDLTEVIISDSVKSIGNEAFRYCDNLTNVIIPDSVTSIGDEAFIVGSPYDPDVVEDYWTGLEYIRIPKSVVNIGDHSIGYGCASNDDNKSWFDKNTDFKIYCYSGSAGEQYAIDNGFDYILMIDNYDYRILDNDTVEIIEYTGDESQVIVPSEIEGKKVTSIGENAFIWCTSLTNITIPNSVISIGAYAFEGCTSLTNITIPNSVTSIGEYAFNLCTSLTNIIVDSKNGYYSSKDGILFNKDKTEMIQYPIGNTRTSYAIPNSVIRIGDDAFRDCTSLTSITIPNSVTSIGFYAFHSCGSLTNITIPNSVTSIGAYAFYGCNSLTSITILASVTSIGYGPFIGCSELQIKCYADSTAEQYAKDNNIPYEIISTKKQISSCTVTLGATTNYFRGTRIKPSVTVKDGTKTLRQGVDYTVAYYDNLSVGTASVKITGKGNYSGTVTKTFKIVQRSIANCDVQLGASSYYFNGTRIRPSVKVFCNGTELYSGNYTVSYANNLAAGTATITLTGKNNLKGTVTKTFKINPRNIANCTVTMTKNTSNKYKPNVSVKIGSAEAYSGNYTVSYVTSADKKTVKVTLTGKNNLSGKITKTYTVS